MVRHASCEGIGERLNGRAPGVHLNAQGRQEAERLAERLASLDVKLVLTSPRERCRETAEAIAGETADLEVCDDLDEVDFGAWTGCEFASLSDDPAWREWNAHRSATRAPGGESIGEVQARVNRAIGKAAARTGDGPVVLVSHAEPIRAALARALGVSLDDWRRFDIAPASVTRLEAVAGGLRVHSVNETFA